VWTHSRIEKERAKAQEVGAANSDKARAAAELRWAKEREKKLQEQSEQCSDDAPSISEALPQNAQSQPQPPSNPDSKKGESNPPPKNNLILVEGSDGLMAIDDSYQPSDPAIEYAYSLGMKKVELNDELRKFITKSISLRVVSFNIDMNFKLWCDRWLAWKRKNNPDWTPAPEVAAAPPEPCVYVYESTLEANCWLQYRKGKPLFFCKQIIDGAERVAARCPSMFPPGYDEATGERIAPSENEDAA
jgi:hypothetical protein